MNNWAILYCISVKVLNDHRAKKICDLNVALIYGWDDNVYIFILKQIHLISITYTLIFEIISAMCGYLYIHLVTSDHYTENRRSPVWSGVCSIIYSHIKYHNTWLNNNNDTNNCCKVWSWPMIIQSMTHHLKF